MEKSASTYSNNANKPPLRRSPRTGSSETLVNIKRTMKQRSEKARSDEFVKDDYEAAQKAKNLIAGRTGIIFDNEMTKHYCFWDSKYPECPDRYFAVVKRCNELGLIDRCERIPSRRATSDEILQLHSEDHLELVKSTCGENNFEYLEDLSSKFDSVYFNSNTYQCATLAAGCAIELVNKICTNSVQNGMAIIRPPGHHAMRNEVCGYCFFNNAALAAQHAVQKHELDRILIVDWDVHHGQGTQRMFYNNPRVMYFSIHRHENGAFWPELRESDFDYVGEKSGKGFNFNVPLNTTGATDADYLAVLQQLLLPIAYQYEPELVIVSAGYDAAVGCPEIQPELIIVSSGYDSALGDEKGEMNVSPACYAHLVSSLMALAKGKVAVLLEGGYCLKSLAEGAALTLRALLGDPAPSLLDFGHPSDSVVESILNVIYVHRPYWQCFQMQESFSIDAEVPNEGNKKNEKTSPTEKRYTPAIRYEGSGGERPEAFETKNCYPVNAPEVAKKCDERLDALISGTDLSVPPNRVALAYSETMTQHQNISDSDHPEKPERIKSIFEKHEEYGLVNRCKLLQTRLATKEELLLVHDEKYVDDVAATAQLSVEELVKKGGSFDSVYFNSKTYECALESAGSVLQVVDEVISRRSRSGVAIVRPPGHHAEKDSACGFCLFNNVALAAKYAVEHHKLQRVLLLDWDVHHGNGSQRMFESENRVLYISLHRYNNGKFFPGSTDADYDKVGVGKGEGFNINIPWNRPGGGLSDGDYITAFHRVVLPVAYEYQPELVLVSAGFDACVHDPLGNCKVTPEAYAHMTYWLTNLANGRVILSLEGGYNVVSISYALTLCTKALLGDPLPPLTSTLVACQSALETIRNVLKTQEKYWRSLRFNVALPKEDVLTPKPAREDGNVEDALVGKLKRLEIDTRRPDIDANHKPGDANQNGRRNNHGRLPLRGSDPANSSRAGSRPTLVEYLSENMQRLLNEEMFAVVPLPGCPHLVEVQAVPPTGISVETPCANCDTDQENWICLICYSVHCGRYVNQHMLQHNEETNHPLTLSFTDLSVWCYVCEAYIDNMVLYPAKNAVHRSKFGSDLQWSYGGERRPPPAPAPSG